MLNRRHDDHAAISGDTIAQVPHTPNPIRLCNEDPNARNEPSEPHGKLFKLRLADTENRRNSASFLIERRYAWRGYEVSKLLPDEPNRITIAAHGASGIVGTISAGLDSKNGLFVDQLYADKVSRLRRPNRRLAEFTKLAIENDIRSKPLLTALFHIAFIYIRRIHGCTDLLIEVNPRHVTFYRRMFGLEQIGEERMDTRVGAPAVLMRLRLAYAEAEIARYGGQSGLASTVRSLYPYTYSPREEAGIEQRLRELG
jgi:hypothetical protein